ncbi:MAG: type I-C CRISPR-associated protein Cas8c/Csd1 [Treponema sp.]|uniref:type I-C CRISPR-associated protein Cas8c/Csd1 n=1 Tax=Treponema sp. TaxID=166 RepID=UPI00298E3880|nr:type I-C CRISPR-associated protein Cas8c/Csd1 [Treponema sp.]MCQ2601725.1 type I-C CRISPR-associated protein Cas8c/Csd1 [Treponema sp.]
MNWITELEKVYDKTIDKKSNDKPFPIYHITNNASLTITLDKIGNFVTADLIDKKDRDRITCMPCTESCSSRSSGADAYPLFDKLEYVSGDGEKFEKYINLLSSWAKSSNSNEKVKAVFNYVSKKTILEDLKSKEIKETDVSDFIRWKVIGCDGTSELWKDEDTQKKWIAFYNSEDFDNYCRNNFSKKEDVEKRVRKNDLNYATGEESKIAVYHPAKIRNGGDKAKIISSNDTTNYTFRGRFLADTEACLIGSDSTQKAHSALRWLVSRQGASIGDALTIVSWNSAGEIRPSLTESSKDLIEKQQDEEIDDGWEETELDKKTSEDVYSTSKEFSDALSNCLHGYYGDISHPENIIVMAIKEATPGQGRASITLFRILQNSDLIEALKKWHEGLSWHICYWKKYDSDEKNHCVYSIGSPSPKDIAECAYGERVKPSMVEKTVQRILPCILDGGKIPSDLEIQCIKSASNLMVIKEENKLFQNSKREKVLGIACAIYKYNRLLDKTKEEYKLALEEDRKTRDYLYGRLLAVAQKLEESALQKMGETRETNAVRFMQQFSIHPASTWKILYEKKLPAYKRHLEPGIVAWYERKIQDITNMFDTNDYLTDKPLSGEYLLGYQCQLKDFYKKSEKTDSENTTELENN